MLARGVDTPRVAGLVIGAVRKSGSLCFGPLPKGRIYTVSPTPGRSFLVQHLVAIPIKNPRLVEQPGGLKRVREHPDFYSMKREYPKLTSFFRFGWRLFGG